MYQEGIERVKLFISDIFHRSIREFPEIKDQNRYTAFRHIWSIQALNGFLEFFNPASATNENSAIQNDLKFIRMNYKHYIVSHLEQLYGLLYGANLDKIKV